MFTQGVVLVNDEQGPLLRTLLLNLFREISVLNGIRLTRHHIVASAAAKLRASVTSRKSSIVRRALAPELPDAEPASDLSCIPHRSSSIARSQSSTAAPGLAQLSI